MAKLPDNITLEKLLSMHISFPRNPEIARVFYRSGQVETWGRGINKILNECEKANKTKPEFVMEGIIFQITFANDIKKISSINSGLNEKQKQILSMIEKNPDITTKELVISVQLTENAVYKNIKLLKEKGLIKREGAKKNGRWIIN